MRTRRTIRHPTFAGLGLLLLLATLALPACDHHYGPVAPHAFDRVIYGSGNVVVQDCPVGGVRGVNLMGFGDLHVDQNGSGLLTIQADDNLLPYIQTGVDGGVLQIVVDGTVDLRPSQPIHYYLSVSSLEQLELAGSGTIDAPSLRVGFLSVLLAGSGNIELFDLDAQELELGILGSGNVFASGRTAQQFIEIAGSGNYQAPDLDSIWTEVGIAGSGSATVRVSEHLTVLISGSGSVYYYGHPIVESTVTGSGSIVRLGG